MISKVTSASMVWTSDVTLDELEGFIREAKQEGIPGDATVHINAQMHQYSSDPREPYGIKIRELSVQSESRRPSLELKEASHDARFTQEA